MGTRSRQLERKLLGRSMEKSEGKKGQRCRQEDWQRSREGQVAGRGHTRPVSSLRFYACWILIIGFSLCSIGWGLEAAREGLGEEQFDGHPGRCQEAPHGRRCWGWPHGTSQSPESTESETESTWQASQTQRDIGRQACPIPTIQRTYEGTTPLSARQIRGGRQVLRTSYSRGGDPFTEHRERDRRCQGRDHGGRQWSRFGSSSADGGRQVGRTSHLVGQGAQAVEERDRGNEDYVQFADRPAPPALHAAGGEAPSRIGSQGSSGLTSPCPWFASQFAVAATGEDTQSSQRRSSCGIRWTTQTSKDDRCSEGRDGYTDYRGQPHRAGQEGEHEQEPQCHGLNHGSLMLAAIIAPAHGWCFQGDGELWLTSSPFSALQGCVQDGVQLGPFVDGMENYVKEISMNSLVDCSGPRSPHESGLVQDVGCDINSPRRVEWIVYRSQIPLASSRFLVDMHSCGVAFQEAYGRCWYSLCLKGLLAEQPYGEGLHDRFHLMKTPRINPTIDDRWKKFWRIIWIDLSAAVLTYGLLRLCERCPSRHYQRAGGRRYSIRTRPRISSRRQQVAIVWSLLLLSVDALPALQQASWSTDDLNQNLGREDTASKTRLRTCLLSGYPGSYTQRFLTADSGYDNLDRQLPYYAWTSTTTLEGCLIASSPAISRFSIWP